VDLTGQLYPPNAAQTKVESHLTNKERKYIFLTNRKQLQQE
jgi:hypothetical protein